MELCYYLFVCFYFSTFSMIAFFLFLFNFCRVLWNVNDKVSISQSKDMHVRQMLCRYDSAWCVFYLALKKKKT